MLLGFLLVFVGLVGGCGSQDKANPKPKPSIAVKTSQLEQICKPESQTRNITTVPGRSIYIVVCLDGRVKEVDVNP